ncbi:hypothetical protein ES707_10576 [subsurface metagenome]
MKGLNCYARIVDDPGIEKFPILDRGKSNFLKPVTLSLSQQGPFMQIAVAGPSRRAQPIFECFLPAAVFLSSSPQVDGGLQSFQLSYHAFVVLAAHRFFLCLSFLSRRLCSFEGDVRKCTLTGKPFFSSRPYIFYRTVGPRLPRGLPFFRKTW